MSDALSWTATLGLLTELSTTAVGVATSMAALSDGVTDDWPPGVSVESVVARAVSLGALGSVVVSRSMLRYPAALVSRMDRWRVLVFEGDVVSRAAAAVPELVPLSEAIMLAESSDGRLTAELVG